MENNAPSWTAYVQSHPTTEIKAPELAHTRSVSPTSYSTTPFPSYQLRELPDSASISSGTTLVGSDIEAAHPTPTHQAVARTRRCCSIRIFLTIAMLAAIACILVAAITIGLCSRKGDLDKCMSSEDPPTYTRHLHSFIKRSIESGKHDRFTWVFGGVFFSFIGFSLLVGLAYTWIMDRLRRGPRKYSRLGRQQQTRLRDAGALGLRQASCSRMEVGQSWIELVYPFKGGG